MSFPCLEFVYSLTQWLTQDSCYPVGNRGEGRAGKRGLPKVKATSGEENFGTHKVPHEGLSR